MLTTRDQRWEVPHYPFVKLNWNTTTKQTNEIHSINKFQFWSYEAHDRAESDRIKKWQPGQPGNQGTDVLKKMLSEKPGNQSNQGNQSSMATMLTRKDILIDMTLLIKAKIKQKML